MTETDDTSETAADEIAASRFVASLEFDAIPEESVEHAALIVADSIGAIIGGSTTPYVQRFAEQSADRHGGSGGGASLFGRPEQTSASRAALVNGAAGSVLEVDEGHKYSAGHPAMHVLPALFADAETGTTPSGEEFLTAFVAGYEIGARTGIACSPMAEEYHMHGVWGTVGAAAGVARLRGYGPERTLTALRIAANHSLHTLFDAATEGATVRNSYTGMSAMNGLLAADQSAAGFSGVTNGLARHLDRTAGDGFDTAAVASELGDRWEFTRGYFKIHAACRYTHGALDAIDRLENAHEFAVADVTAVRVETYPAAARLQRARPTTDLGAKFSIPFAVATRLLQGHSGKEAFSADALTPAAHELAEAVAVTVADDLAAQVPSARPTRVTIELGGDRTLTEEVTRPRGDAANPLTQTALRSKFQRLVEPVLGAAATDLWTTANKLPAVSPTRVAALASGRGQH